MWKLTIPLAVCVLAATCAPGCSRHNVKYSAYRKNAIAPTASAIAVHGRIDEAKELIEQSRLPHNTVRQSYELERRAWQSVYAQLGSPDYLVIGEVYGGGSARASLATLEAAFCKRAAREGGDVVLIFDAGIEQRPFSYTTPGYAQTNVYATAYQTGNYLHGHATGYTTYTPGQTYSGVLNLPHASGLVFKHVPGIDVKRARMAALDDAALERTLANLVRWGMDKSLTFEEVLQRWDALIQPRPAPSAETSGQPVAP